MCEALSSAPSMRGAGRGDITVMESYIEIHMVFIYENSSVYQVMRFSLFAFEVELANPTCSHVPSGARFCS